jgi:hypothetical protein
MSIVHGKTLGSLEDLTDSLLTGGVEKIAGSEPVFWEMEDRGTVGPELIKSGSDDQLIELLSDNGMRVSNSVNRILELTSWINERKHNKRVADD